MYNYTRGGIVSIQLYTILISTDNDVAIETRPEWRVKVNSILDEVSELISYFVSYFNSQNKVCLLFQHLLVFIKVFEWIT